MGWMVSVCCFAMPTAREGLNRLARDPDLLTKMGDGALPRGRKLLPRYWRTDVEPHLRHGSAECLPRKRERKRAAGG